MSSQIQCRQCGKSLPRSDFPTGEFKCPDCNWTQLLSPSGRSRLKKPKNKAAKAAAAVEAAVAAPPETVALDEDPAVEPDPSLEADPGVAAAEYDSTQHEPTRYESDDPSHRPLAPLAVLDLEGLRRLTSGDFRAWCDALLCRFGTTTADEPHGYLELVRGGERVLVDCIPFCERENVGRPEAQKLIEAMAERGIVRGMLLSPGYFEKGCRVLADESETVRLQLVDGDRLEQTANEIASGPLAEWWS